MLMTTKKNITINLSGGLLGTLLTVLFVYLKTTGQIDWSWWWVLCPLWIIPLVVILITLSCLMVLFVCWLIQLIAYGFKK